MEARIRNPLRTVENAAGGGDGGQAALVCPMKEII